MRVKGNICTLPVNVIVWTIWCTMVGIGICINPLSFDTTELTDGFNGKRELEVEIDFCRVGSNQD